MTTRAEVVAEARRWIGTRWQHQACVAGVACDCIGLIAGVGGALGMPGAGVWRADARRLSYTRAPQPEMLLAAADAYLERIEPDALGAGDVALLRARIDLPPQHFGILTDAAPRTVIHAYAQMRRVVEQDFAPWAPLLVRAYRYPGVA